MVWFLFYFNSCFVKLIFIISIKIPRYRPFVQTDVLEYYPFGHDPSCSILSGITFEVKKIMSWYIIKIKFDN